MLREIRPAIVLLVALTLITGLAYPLAMTGLAQVLFPRQANGSLIEQDGKVVGSALIGQAFTERQLLPWPAVRHQQARSQRRDQDGRCALQRRQLHAARTSGPTNKALIDRVKGDVDKLKAREPLGPGADRPGDHHGQRARPAHLAARPPCSRCRASPRRATCRRIACASSSTRTSRAATLGLLGEPRVNVLALNMALDRAAAR